MFGVHAFGRPYFAQPGPGIRVLEPGAICQDGEYLTLLEADGDATTALAGDADYTTALAGEGEWNGC